MEVKFLTGQRGVKHTRQETPVARKVPFVQYTGDGGAGRLRAKEGNRLDAGNNEKIAEKKKIVPRRRG